MKLFFFGSKSRTYFFKETNFGPFTGPTGSQTAVIMGYVKGSKRWFVRKKNRSIRDLDPKK